MNRRLEASAIFWTHGPADAITTIAASRAVGIYAEANPIVGELLAVGEIAAVVGMVACVAVAAAAWPTAADAIDAPPAAAGIITTIGMIVAAGNLAVIAL